MIDRSSERNKKIIQQWKINYKLWKASKKPYYKISYRHAMIINAMRLIGRRP